jgi:hypothetical protein
MQRKRKASQNMAAAIASRKLVLLDGAVAKKLGFPWEGWRSLMPGRA